MRTQKDKHNIVRLTASGNRLDYYARKSSEAVSLETIQIILNNMVLTRGVKFGVAIGTMYSNTKLISLEYMWTYT